MSLQNTQYNLPLTQAYNSVLFAFPGSGSFSLSRALPTVTMDPSSLLQAVDVSGSLQINVPLSYFTINSATDSSGILVTDNITFTSTHLKEILSTTPSPIASIGSLSNLFLNYDNYVAAYFGYTAGFTLPFTLLNTSNGLSGNNSYDANGYIDGVTSSAANRNLTSDQVRTFLTSPLTDLSGTITVPNITKLLTFVCSRNTFNNRNQGDTFTLGFKAGDLIYITGGLKINLNTNISNNGISKIATISTSTAFNAIDNSFSTLYDVTNTSGKIMDYTFSSNNINSNLNLSVSVPLLLRLIA